MSLWNLELLETPMKRLDHICSCDPRRPDTPVQWNRLSPPTPLSSTLIRQCSTTCQGMHQFPPMQADVKLWLYFGYLWYKKLPQTLWLKTATSLSLMMLWVDGAHSHGSHSCGFSSVDCWSRSWIKTCLDWLSKVALSHLCCHVDLDSRYHCVWPGQFPSPHAASPQG